MNKKSYRFHIYGFIASIAVLAGCQTLPKQDIVPEREEKYTEITVVNDDYPRTSDELYKLTDAAGGEIAGGSASFDEYGGRAEFQIDVPYENYETFLESFNREFGLEAAERETRSGVSIAYQYAQLTKEIEDKTEALQNVEKFSGAQGSDPAVIDFERKKLDKEIARLRTKRIETLARMDRGRIVVKWLSPESGLPMNYYPAPFPDMPIPGLPYRKLDFDAPGASQDFNFGENVEVNLNMPNAEEMNLTATVDYDAEKVTLKANAPGARDTVVLNHMCQSVIVSGDVIPEVRLAGALATEQIVITPMVDDKCGRIGYEIRAGTLERGCNKGESKRIFNMLAKCRGDKPKAATKPAVKKRSKSKDSAKAAPQTKAKERIRRVPSSRKAGSKNNARLKKEIIDYIKRLP